MRFHGFLTLYQIRAVRREPSACLLGPGWGEGGISPSKTPWILILSTDYFQRSAFLQGTFNFECFPGIHFFSIHRVSKRMADSLLQVVLFLFPKP